MKKLSEKKENKKKPFKKPKRSLYIFCIIFQFSSKIEKGKKELHLHVRMISWEILHCIQWGGTGSHHISTGPNGSSEDCESPKKVVYFGATG